ncbi:MAG: YlxR family protein [Aurantimicrobium sp.]|nr:YlxR family protein [Aurantimicrobium sp.]
MKSVRTCIGCRSTDDRSSLVRLVVVEGRVVVDLSSSAHGRGAWLHADRQCLEQATVRRAFARALRYNAPDTAHLTQHWQSFTGNRG